MDFITHQWCIIGDSAIQRTQASVTAVDDVIYVIGGYDPNGKLLKSIETYSNQTWSLLGDFEFPVAIRSSG